MSDSARNKASSTNASTSTTTSVASKATSKHAQAAAAAAEKGAGGGKSKSPKPPPNNDSAAAAAPRTPLPTLYTDVLYSIFSFVTLRDLSVLSRVSAHWASSVHSMHPLGVQFTAKAPLKPLCNSRLARHINDLILPPQTVCSTQLLEGLNKGLPNLTSLALTFPSPAPASHVKPAGRWPTEDEVASYAFPPKLRRILLRFPFRCPPAVVNAVFTTLVQRSPALEVLKAFHCGGASGKDGWLGAAGYPPTDGSATMVRYHSLKQLERLRVLVLGQEVKSVATPTEGAFTMLQREDLRGLTALETLDVQSLCQQAAIEALFAPIQTLLPWTSLPLVAPSPVHPPPERWWRVDDTLACRIVDCLPRMTDLRISFLGASNFEWISRLPASSLRSLSLRLPVSPPRTAAADAAAGAGGAGLVQGLKSLTGLTRLVLLRGGGLSCLSTENLGEILSSMPMLHSLSLSLASAHALTFLSAGPSLASTLRDLELEGESDREPSEFEPLHGLHQLEHLSLRGVLASGQPALPFRSLLRIPPDMMPHLRVVHILPAFTDHRGEGDGPVVAAVRRVAAPPLSMAASREREAERVAKANAWMKEQKKKNNSKQ